MYNFSSARIVTDQMCRRLPFLEKHDIYAFSSPADAFQHVQKLLLCELVIAIIYEEMIFDILIATKRGGLASDINLRYFVPNGSCI